VHRSVGDLLFAEWASKGMAKKSSVTGRTGKMAAKKLSLIAVTTIAAYATRKE